MTSEPLRLRLALRLARFVAGKYLAAVTARVDDSPGWQAITAAPHDRDAAEIQKLYKDALTAWRKNPMAKRALDVITDYTIGDGISLDAPGEIGRFIHEWWNHPKNNMDMRLPDLSDELARSGDLFVSLHRNKLNGMSYVRAMPKDLITAIKTAENDWENELEYHQAPIDIESLHEPIVWLAPHHPDAEDADAVMLHFAVNRPVGALMGESDIGTALPWLLRYSRMLEDRVRLHWAVRAFLWLVTVPTPKVAEKKAQYAAPPESGSVIVKDEGEKWEPVTPDLRATDAQHDLKAVRHMTDAGTGLPPHWRGEGENINLATAKAMHDPTVRHLRRRQLYIRYMLVDLAHAAYSRAHEIGKVTRKPNRSLITAALPDISRDDNASLANAARDVATGMATMVEKLTPEKPSKELAHRILRTVFKFAGEMLSDDQLEELLPEVQAQPTPALQKPKEPDNGANDQ